MWPTRYEKFVDNVESVQVYEKHKISIRSKSCVSARLTMTSEQDGGRGERKYDGRLEVAFLITSFEPDPSAS